MVACLSSAEYEINNLWMEGLLMCFHLHPSPCFIFICQGHSKTELSLLHVALCILLCIFDHTSLTCHIVSANTIVDQIKTLQWSF